MNKYKSCFGQYEDFEVSWHCKGCLFKERCKSYSNKSMEKRGNEKWKE